MQLEASKTKGPLDRQWRQELINASTKRKIDWPLLCLPALSSVAFTIHLKKKEETFSIAFRVAYYFYLVLEF